MVNRQKYDFSTRKIKKMCDYGPKDFADYANKIINGILPFTWPKTKSWQSLKISKRQQKFQAHQKLIKFQELIMKIMLVK